MPYPEAMFASKWRQHKYKGRSFKFLKRCNIVHHMSLILPAYGQHLRSSLYRTHPQSTIKTSGPFAAANLERTNGKHAHMRIRTLNDGKFLMFGTGNIILAGRKSHASACLSSIRMSHVLSQQCKDSVNLWPAAQEAPNSVITGQLAFPISPTIKDDSVHVNYSTKFPGIAMSVSAPGVTPELYLRRSMIIIPGITSAAQLATVVADVEKIIKPYALSPAPADPADATRSPGPSTAAGSAGMPAAE